MGATESLISRIRGCDWIPFSPDKKYSPTCQLVLRISYFPQKYFSIKIISHFDRMISAEASNRLQLAMIILSPTIVGRQQLSTGGASPGTIKSFFHSHHLLNAHPHGQFSIIIYFFLVNLPTTCMWFQIL